MEKSPIYWDLSHIFRCHSHQHHHLFWKQPFLPCSARRLLLATNSIGLPSLVASHSFLHLHFVLCWFDWRINFLLLLARRLLRYEDMTSVHISLNIAHSGCKPCRHTLGECVNVDMELPGLLWMGKFQGYVDIYIKTFMARRRNSTSTEEVARSQHFFSNPSWMTAGRTSSHEKTHSSIPMDRHLFMVTK